MGIVFKSKKKQQRNYVLWQKALKEGFNDKEFGKESWGNGPQKDRGIANPREELTWQLQEAPQRNWNQYGLITLVGYW